MANATRVDLHLHSTVSDGRLSPEDLAGALARRRVAVAALTDHDTVEGLPSFERALRRRGIGHISGVELTTWLDDRKVDLLGYAFDAEDRELLATLASVRQAQARVDILSVTAGLRDRATAAGDPPSAALAGRLNTLDAIRLIHRCGGVVILAHPFAYGQGTPLDALIQRLTETGLDGIEAFYQAYGRPQQEELVALAHKYHLLVSGGSDYHDGTTGGSDTGVQIPNPLWKVLRDRVSRDTSLLPDRPTVLRHRRSWRRFFFHIIFPTGLAILLFVVAIWCFFLPTFEQSLLDRKREMIRELANLTWGIMAEAHDAELRGEMTREAAQRAAAARIERLRYGREGKDYFWVQDSTPRMIMHPYRKDLDGQDVSEFKDPRGVRIFAEFADLVHRRQQGYVEYVWQWQDDPRRLVLKESYVRGFAPWGWIIGTGIYIDDVRQEISRLERGLVYGSLAIVAAMATLLVFVVRESQQLEKERCDAEEHLEESHQQYRSLVEATAEGTLLIVRGRCRYANSAMLRLLGAQRRQLELMDLEDVLPRTDDNAAVWQSVRRAEAGEEWPPTAGLLTYADNASHRVQITASPIQLGNETGLVLRVSQGSMAGSSVSSGLASRLTDAEELAVAIAAAEIPERVAELCRTTPALAGNWSDRGISPQRITSSLSGICDAATRRLVDLAVGRAGPPPMQFAFIAMGSQGRQEQTLYTDQDNALILEREFADVCEQAYFTQVGQFVNHWLDVAGYGFCKGEVMARNPRWCVSLAAWERYFDGWIAKAEPAELLDVSIFFDLRAICGSTVLADTLRSHVDVTVKATPGFLPHFARNAMEFKAPMRLFGRIVAADTPGKLNLKDAMMPVVSFARLYALRLGLGATNTMQRLRDLAQAEVLAELTLRDLTIAYDFLTALRIQHQLSLSRLGAPMDNSIDYHQLSHIQAALLRETFREIDTMQQKIRYDLLGGTT